MCGVHCVRFVLQRRRNASEGKHRAEARNIVVCGRGPRLESFRRLAPKKTDYIAAAAAAYECGLGGDG